MASLKGPLIGTIVSALLTWTTHATAVELQSGIQHEYAGRRAGVKKLLASAAEALGPTGTLVVGGGITLAMIAWLVINLKRRSASTAPQASPAA